MANLEKMTLLNPYVDLVNDNVYTKFGLIRSIYVQDIEQNLTKTELQNDSMTECRKERANPVY